MDCQDVTRVTAYDWRQCKAEMGHEGPHYSGSVTWPAEVTHAHG